MCGITSDCTRHLRHSARGASFFAHARAQFETTVKGTSVMDREPTRGIFVGHTFRFRLRKHTADDMVCSYPTDAFLAFAVQDPPQLIQEVPLIGGYRWDPETREMGTAVLSARDGKSNVLWVVELAEGAEDGGVSHFEPRVPDSSLPPLPTVGESIEIDRDRKGHRVAMSSLGEVIITGRVAGGMTQEELANATGVAQAAMSRYENDLREPEPETAERIADALGVTTRFLERTSRPAAALALEAHMRRRATAKPTVWRQMEAQLNLLALHSDFLREEIALASSLAMPGFDPFTTDPADAARMTRSQWHMPAGPARSIVRWIEAAGSVVDSVNPTDRIRWTLAHEVGHLVIHREDTTDDMEREADAFAAEFLMPELLIRPELANLTLGKAVDLKRQWGVSVAALIQRAHQLRGPR